jgi:hypothetical protein
VLENGGADDTRNKLERREHKKSKRKFRLHGGSIRTMYLNVVKQRLWKLGNSTKKPL